MGLDTSHDCWHGAYSSFMRWRIMLCWAAGLPPLRFMEGFWKKNNYDDPWYVARQRRPKDEQKDAEAADEMFYTSCLPILWDCLKPDPLHVLLRHSDCDGYILADDCGPIADALEALLLRIEEYSEEPWGHIEGSWVAKTQTFIDGLRRAAEADEMVRFH